MASFPLGRLALAAAAAVLLSGCPSDEECAPRVVSTDQECSITQDCIDEGYVGLSCINGVCARGCARDDDCVLGSAADDPCRDQQGPDPVFICEAELCAVGCPSVPCAAGEECVNGRCALYHESFELSEGQDVVTLENLGWDAVPREVTNRETAIVFSGPPGCTAGDDRCAGPSGDGARFLAVERVPTPELGTPENDVTCRACACCLACRLNPPAPGDAGLLALDRCPASIPEPVSYQCTAATPAVCTGVCDQCDACTNAVGRTIGEGLLTCERDVAPKTCTGCVAYDACVAARSCTNTADPCFGDADCQGCILRSCEPMRPACFACRDAVLCDSTNPGSAMCRMLHQTCDAQGAEGCFATPIARPRSQLTDHEQSSISPVIPGVAGGGAVVLQFEYVPFDIRETWRRVEQGVPREMWELEPQEVVVQLCSGGCEQATSWVDGNFVTGGRASFPPAGQRRNGLSFGGQSSLDWRSNRVEVDIPEAMRTAELRFRFVPLLVDDARVGIDNVLVRRR